jgi:phosphoglycolate phosphatase-like HAD superfamily hydrolase
VSGWERQEFQCLEPKIVAFDFDETISDNETLWLQVMLALEKGGYHVVVCTWRTPTTYPEDLKFLVDRGFKVYYTSGQAKQTYMESKGIKVSIWIDDNPFAILNNAK